MLYLAILLLLTVISSLVVKRMLFGVLMRIKDNLRDLDSEYANTAAQNSQIKSENSNLERGVESIITLYDITKEISKTLDEDKIFAIFKENIIRYIKVKDCRFVKDEKELSRYKNYMVLPLKIQEKAIGYLAAYGIGKEEEDKFVILAQQFISVIKRAFLYQRVQELTITDGLTLTFNRRHFLERCNDELKRSKKLKHCFSFLMVDLDYFKECNDHYGHLVGDVILREVAREIKENIRQIDFIGRYGGEELSIILTETDKGQALYAAERIRQAIASRQIRAYDEDLKITVSIGISTFPDDAGEIQTLIDKADESLYLAKKAGRNRVCVFNAHQ